MSDCNSTASPATGKPTKPGKPYAEFPLTAHPAGYWCKKIRGKIHYFGKWGDPDAALAEYLRVKEALHAGRKPRADPDALTVKDLANAFLLHKEAMVLAGELSPHTFRGYKEACVAILGNFGKERLAADLGTEDFAEMRNKLSRAWGPHRLAKTIQYVRSVFKFGYDVELLNRPVRFGPGFKRPSKKTMRLNRARQGLKLFTPKEICKMLTAAGTALKAMILLGVNCGFGNADCANLPRSAVDLKTRWIDYPRPKTGIARRCPLWSETVAAIKAALAHRPEPKNPEHAGLVFITKYGEAWHKATSDNPISKETRKLLDELGIEGHRNFYTLRHVFRTVADESKDQPAVDHIMGHARDDMASAYRERIGDERLKAVVDVVRKWLFVEREQAK